MSFFFFVFELICLIIQSMQLQDPTKSKIHRSFLFLKLMLAKCVRISTGYNVKEIKNVTFAVIEIC